jgi:hypothetical protein
MDMIKYFGKLLLLVIVPISFIVVSTTVVSALIAVISCKADGMSFDASFKAMLPLATLLMTLTALAGFIVFFVNKED